MSVPVLDGDVLALDVAEITESLAEGRDIGLGRRRRFHGDDDADPWDLSSQLRLSGERSREDAGTNRGQEGTARDHWITSFARISSDGGIVNPSALAVLRLMTSSNLVGCSIGRSAALAPFKILST